MSAAAPACHTPGLRVPRPPRFVFWLHAGFWVAVSVAVTVRFAAMPGPFDVPELEFVTPPWSEPTQFADPWQRTLQALTEELWQLSLDESVARLPGVAASVANTALIGWVVTVSFGPLAGVAAAMAMAMGAHPAVAGTLVNAGPWVVLASLLVIAVSVGCASLPGWVRVSLVVLGSMASVWLTPWAWPVALAAGASFVRYDRRLELQGLVPALASLGIAGLAAWSLGEPTRSFFRPWTWSSVWSLQGQWSPTVAFGMWVLVVVGLYRVLASLEGRWLLWWLAGIVVIGLLAQLRRWVVPDAGLALTTVPVLALVGVGAAEVVGKWWPAFVRRSPATEGALVATLVAGVSLPGTVHWVTRATPDWRAIASVVRENAGRDDAMVTSLCRRAVVFYAPELFTRFPKEADPGRALVVFPAATSGWFVVPRRAHLFPAWGRVEQWIQQFGVIDLSPDPEVHVFYYRRDGRGAALRRAAEFALPVATLRRGRLLADLLEVAGASPSILWKIDQLVLEPQAIVERNESLVHVVRELVRLGQADRARSLAQRLVAFDPEWESARNALVTTEASSSR